MAKIYRRRTVEWLFPLRYPFHNDVRIIDEDDGFEDGDGLIVAVGDGDGDVLEKNMDDFFELRNGRG